MARRGFGRWPVRLLTGVIRGYQIFISPHLGPCCRFTPSCSQYAVTALERHGFWRGSWLALRRVLRCQPWCRGGYDPVPPARAERKKSSGGRGEAGSGNNR